MSVIRSRDNPRVKRWMKMAVDASFRRSEARAMVEGPHLVAEAISAGLDPVALIVSEAGLANPEVRRLVAERDAVVLADGVFAAVADAESPPGIAAEIKIPRRSGRTSGPAVFLQGVQDPGNVGAIVRSAAAFGIEEVVLDQACADAWGPKVLRAAMGGHFRLALRQVRDLDAELEGFNGTTVCAIPSGGEALHRCALDGRLGWIFGAEGRGVSEAIARRAALKVSIPMAARTESLNVAAAAAICLYEAFSRRAGES
jgi:TrmH family RNA methyltransferase